MKRVLVATGISTAKTNYAVKTITAYCKEKNIDVEIDKRNIFEINKEKKSPDLIIVLGKNDLETKIPVIKGRSFLTENRIKKTCEEVISYLR